MLKELSVKLGADFSQFERAMRTMQEKVGQVGSAVASFSKKVDSKMKEAEKAFDDFAKKPEEAREAVSELGSNINTYFTLPVLAAGAAAIKFSSDASESINKVNVAFGSSAQSVLSWSESSIDAMGLASSSALDAAALFGDMGTSMGLTQEEAATMSMSMVQLGADLASFKNISIEQAMAALNGVFTGETESLKMLGVVMTQTQLEAFALSRGIQKNVQDMSEAELINLRYAFVMAKTTNAQGDFKRTSEGTANQMRMFKENIKELAQSFGDLLIPKFTEGLTKLNEFIKAIKDLPDGVKTAIIDFSGLTIAIGALLFTVPKAIGFVEKFKEAFKVTIGFLSKFRYQLGIVGLAFAAITVWTLAVKNFIEYWDIFSIRFMSGISKIIPAIELVTIKIMKFANDSIIYLTDLAIRISNLMGMNVDSLESFRQKLIESRNEIAVFAANNQLEISTINYRTQTALLSAEIDRLNEKQNENAGKTEYVTAKYKDMSTIASIVKDAQEKVNAGLEKGKENAEKFAQAQKELVTQSVKVADTVGNAIIQALRNRQKIEDETIKKLETNLDNSRKLYSDWLADFKQFNENYVANAKAASETVISEINRRYDAEQKRIDDQISEQTNPYENQLSTLERSLDEERKMNEESAYEAEKAAKFKQFIQDRADDSRIKHVDDLSELMIKRDEQLNKDGTSLRIESLEYLTDAENKILRDRINEARTIRKQEAKMNIDAIKQDFALQAVINEANRQSEIAKEQQKLQTDLANFKAIQDQKLKLRTDDYNSVVQYLTNELEQLKKNYVDYSSEVTAQNAAKKILIEQDQKSIIELLKSYNPDWKAAGKSFGEMLYDGLKDKYNDIKTTVNNMMELVGKASAITIPTTKTTAPKVVTPKTKMAEGGIVTAPTVALIGEGTSPEAVIPLNRLSDFVGQQETHIYLDGREITKRVAPQMVDTIRTKLGVAY